MENKENTGELNDELLETVSGGDDLPVNKRCPLCRQPLGLGPDGVFYCLTQDCPMNPCRKLTTEHIG